MITPVKYTLLAALLLLCVASLLAHDYIPAPPQTAPILLKGGNLYTVSDGVQENTDLLFENGRITQIGQNLTAPTGAQIIDVTGMSVYPGLLNAYTRLGLIEIGAVRATNDISETGQNNADIQAHVAYNPDSEIIPTVRANGITTALIVPGGSLIQGQSSLMNLDGWTKEDSAEKMRVFMHMSWPAVRIQTGWWVEKFAEQQKKEMDENRAAIGRLFDDARAYMLAKQADPNTNIDSRWEAMLPVLTGEMPLVIEANDFRQIEEAVAFCKERGIRMILAGGDESWKVADLLKEYNIPVILANTTALPMRHDDPYDLAYRIPGMLQKSGIKFCIATFDASGARNLPFQAGYAVAYGSIDAVRDVISATDAQEKPPNPQDPSNAATFKSEMSSYTGGPFDKHAALRAITLSAAEILGVEKDLGSLEVGKKATIVVSRGDILNPLTAGVTHVFIQGRTISLANRHTDLYHKFQAKKPQPMVQ